ncbi:contractile injection system protein, VgrG/Pvc8 family [Leptotrichia massiliensis]|uniref:phage late control D family protein n=1 Tax=Leptotrichia massiliensis TaxID=1852388 RepID=UPI0028D10F53|nr:contractile injection system protein, VgrG/Pvc8 family [Leptotrichia massiliensis]
MAFARNIRVIVIFNKVDISDEIAHSISSLNYTDNSKNAIDDLELELENLDYRWLKEWYPDENAQLLVGIHEENENETNFLDLGTFYVDEPTFENNRLNLKCLALPLDQNIRDQKNSVAWERVTLKELVTQIANKHEMNAEIYSDNEFFERLDQNQETDLAFINRVVKETGLNMKVSDDKIIIFDDEEMEKNDTVEIFNINDERIRSFSLKKKNKEIYDNVEVSYYDPDKKKVIKEIITKKELEKRNQVTTESSEEKSSENKKSKNSSKSSKNKKSSKKVKSKKK